MVDTGVQNKRTIQLGVLSVAWDFGDIVLLPAPQVAQSNRRSYYTATGASGADLCFKLDFSHPAPGA